MSEMKSRIVAEAVFCHFGFEPKGRKNEWLSILKALTMQRKINFEDAILEWATMSGEYRNGQWIAAHKDGTLNEDNGFETLSLFGSDPGQIYFPECGAVMACSDFTWCSRLDFRTFLTLSSFRRPFL